MFIILASVLNLGNVTVENNDDGEAVVGSGPGTALRNVAVSITANKMYRLRIHTCHHAISYM